MAHRINSPNAPSRAAFGTAALGALLLSLSAHAVPPQPPPHDVGLRAPTTEIAGQARSAKADAAPDPRPALLAGQLLRQTLSETVAGDPALMEALERLEQALSDLETKRAEGR
jgi:hypothetical protein